MFARKQWQRLAGWSAGAYDELVLGLALLLMVMHIPQWAPLWYDEVYSLALARLPLLQSIRLAAEIDFSPPGWNVLLWGWVRLFGESEFVLRAPAALCSMLAVALTWMLLHEMQVSRVQRVMALALSGLLPGMFWLSNDARMYAALSVLYLGGALLIRRRMWLGLAGVLGLLGYVHFTGVIYAVALCILAWIVAPDVIERRRQGLVWSAAIAAWMPLVGVAQSRLDVGAGSLYGPPRVMWMLASLQDAIWAWTLPGWLGLLAFCALVVSVVGAGMISLGNGLAPEIRHETEAETPWLALWALLPLGGFVFAALLRLNLVTYRTLAPVVIPLAIWVAVTLAPRRWTRTSWVLPAVWVICLAAGHVFYDPQAHGGAGFREVVASLEAAIKPGDVIWYSDGLAALPMEHYLDKPTLLTDDPGQAGYVRLAGFHTASLADLPGRVWVIGTVPVDGLPVGAVIQYHQTAAIYVQERP